MKLLGTILAGLGIVVIAPLIGIVLAFGVMVLLGKSLWETRGGTTAGRRAEVELAA